MGPIKPHPFSGNMDLRAMEILARNTRSANLHITDLPYRFSSWAFDEPENIHLWKGAGEKLLAWAILQSPWWTLDYAIHPQYEADIHPQILEWADRRASGILGSPYGRSSWFVMTFCDQTERQCHLEAAGFAYQADDGERYWSKVLMERPADVPMKTYRIPDGFIVRPLDGDNEIEDYIALHQETFGSKNMTADWRQRTLQHPNHDPELDLVVAAPDGKLAAFCVCWLDPDEPIGQIEPLGCHPSFRHYALGRVALLEGLHRLQAKGVKKILVETDNYRNTAFRLYESMGFSVVRDVMVYRKDYY